MRPKTTLMAAIAALSLAYNASSQIRFNNQWAITASGGYVTSNGFSVSAGAERILGSPAHSISGEISLQSKGFTTSTSIREDFDVRDYLVRASYTYTLGQLLLDRIYCGFSIGAIGGYETITANLKTAMILEKDKFVYGGTASVKAEYALVRSLSLFLEPRVTYMTSNFKKFIFNPQIGLKYYL